MSNLLKNGFPDEEFQRRIAKIVDYINRENLDAYIVMEPYNLFYLGMYYSPGKRPLAFVIHSSGRVEAFVPDMEYYAASQLKYLYKVFPYDDNYDKAADMFSFMNNQVKADFGAVRRVQVDAVSLEQYYRLNDIFDDCRVVDALADIRAIKSPLEIEMMRASARYSDAMVANCRRHMHPGATEMGIMNRGITDTVDQMIADGIAVIYVPGGPAGALMPSGVNTAKPHSLPSERAVSAGENMILSCGANVWGYRTECERTVFLGDPTDEMAKAFEVMRQAQALGIALMKPGAVCEDVERQVLAFIKDAGYGDWVRHRTGHGKGLEEHEPPYVAAGDKTVMQPGMIFSSEPGLYRDGFAGFRHSDNVLITETGSESLAGYPKDLESLITRI